MPSIENGIEANGEFDLYEDTYNQFEAHKQSQPFIFIIDSDENVDKSQFYKYIIKVNFIKYIMIN